MILSAHYKLYNPTIGHKIVRGIMYFDINIYRRSGRMIIESCFMITLSIISHKTVITINTNKEVMRTIIYRTFNSICAVDANDNRRQFALLDIVITRELVSRYYAVGANGQLYVIPKNE